GERHPTAEAISGLEAIFSRELLEQAFDRHHKGMEVIEGQVVHGNELIEPRAAIVGRRFVIERVHQFLAEQDRGLLAIEAQPGKGKTALLAHLVMEVFAQSAPQPVSFFYRRTGGVSDPGVCVRSLYQSLLNAHGITEAGELKRKNSPAEVLVKLTN